MNTKYITIIIFFLLVTNLFADDNIKIVPQTGHTNDVTSVAISNDNKYIVSGSWDTGIKTWSIDNSNLISTSYGFIDGEWVTVTPQNYYVSSKNGDKYVAFRKGNEFVDLERYSKIFKKDKVVAGIIAGKKLEDILEDLNLEEVKISDLADPIIKWLNEDDEFVFREKAFIKIKYECRYNLKTIIFDFNGKLEILNINKVFDENKKLLNIPVTLDAIDNYFQIIVITTQDVESERITGNLRLKNLNGKYYALLIAINDYDNMDDLKRPVNDAEKLKDVLETNYVFEKIEIWKNKTRSEIIDKFDEYMESLTQNDSFLIFFSGHGSWDAEMNTGYWLAKDAKNDKRSAWIQNSVIQSYMKGFKCKHVLIIADSCFGGSILFREENEDKQETRAAEELMKYKSRKAMTSGYLTKVPDNSAFFKYLYQNLKNNTKKHLSSLNLLELSNKPCFEGFKEYGMISLFKKKFNKYLLFWSVKRVRASVNAGNFLLNDFFNELGIINKIYKINN